MEPRLRYVNGYERGESVSSRMTMTTGLTGHEDLQEGRGPEFKLGRLHLRASRLCARRREAKPTGNGQNISRHSKRSNLFIAPCWLTAVLLPLENELLPERFHQSKYQYYTNYHRSLPRPLLTLQACPSSFSALWASTGFWMTRPPAFPEKSMATRLASDVDYTHAGAHS